MNLVFAHHKQNTDLPNLFWQMADNDLDVLQTAATAYGCFTLIFAFCIEALL